MSDLRVPFTSATQFSILTYGLSYSSFLFNPFCMTFTCINNPLAIAGIIFSSLNQSIRPYFPKVCQLWVWLVKMPLKIPACSLTPCWWIQAGCSTLSQFSAHVPFIGVTGALGEESLTFCPFCFLTMPHWLAQSPLPMLLLIPCVRFLPNVTEAFRKISEPVRADF